MIHLFKIKKIGTLCHLEIVCPSAASAENRYFQFSGQWYEMLRACDDWKSSAAASSSYSALEAFLMKECILHVLPSSSSSLQQQLRWKWDDAHEFELVPESELKDHHPPQQQSPQLTWMLEGMGSEQIADWCTKQTDEVLQFVCQMSSNLRKGWSHVECFLQQHGGVTRYIQQECEKIDQGHDGGGEWQWMDGHWYRPIAAVKNKKNKLVTTEEGEESVKKTKL